MNVTANGELVPAGGGDKIPLVHDALRIGRRQSCDICLDFSNVSSNHCELHFVDGCWQIVDLGSTNGTKVNGERVRKRKLRPGDKLLIGKRAFTIDYQPAQNANLDSIDEDRDIDILKQPLLERAGLAKKKRNNGESRRPRQKYRREYQLDDVDDDD